MDLIFNNIKGKKIESCFRDLHSSLENSQDPSKHDLSSISYPAQGL